MFDRGTGWGIRLPVYTLNIAVGGIAEEPGVVGVEIAIRQYRCLTLGMDHDIVDGPLRRVSPGVSKSWSRAVLALWTGFDKG